MREETLKAMEAFSALIEAEYDRIERMKADWEVTDFAKKETITIGVMPGDGGSPILMEQALRVMKKLLAPELESGKVRIRIIEGMTIKRRAELNESLPADVLAACKECGVLIKGPFVMPLVGGPASASP